MLSENLSSGRAVPPALIAIAAAIKAARDAITVYESVRIVASEVNGDPGTIRSMIANPNRGPALDPETISNMSTQMLAQSIALDDPFDESSVTGLLDPNQVAEMFMNASREEEAGRLAVSELERRFADGTAEEQQEIIDMMQARQLVTESDEQARENQQRADAFNSTTRDVFGALGDLGEAFFGRPRKSSDSALVSMERHEYDYCCGSPLKIFSLVTNAVSEGGTYLQAMFHALNKMLDNAIAGIPDRDGNTLVFNADNLLSDRGVESFQELQDQLTTVHAFANDGSPNNAFYSYGNWVDSPFMRKGIALIRKLVRTVRSANVTEILRLTTGETPPEFFVRLLENLNYVEFANVLREFVGIDLDLDGSTSLANPNNPRQGFVFNVVEGDPPEA